MLRKDEAVNRLANSTFDAMGYRPDRASLSSSFLGFAAETGLGSLPSPTARYHFEEAIVIRFWAMESEGRCGLIQYLMQEAERELHLPVTALGITRLDILRAMTTLTLARAGERMELSGSSPLLSEVEATSILRSRFDVYEKLVIATLECTKPVPAEPWRAGVEPRNHPHLEWLGCCADSLCEGLGLPVDGAEAMAIQLSLLAKWKGLYRGLNKLGLR